MTLENGIKCKHCMGDGTILEKGELRKCEDCKGKGKIEMIKK